MAAEGPIGGAGPAGGHAGTEQAGTERAGTERPGTGRAGAASRRARGRSAHHSGRAAEGVVARHYEGLGLSVLDARWRGEGGEIDLVLQDGDGLVFVEVKSAACHAAAARSLTPRQAARLLGAGAEYLGTRPAGSLTPARFDVALVDRAGRVEVIENALGQ